MATLIEGISDDQLKGPCPCSEITLGDLVHHISEFTIVFTGRGEEGSRRSDERRAPDASQLGDDWRTRIPADVALLAKLGADPDAWTGMTKAGGLDMPGEVAGIVVLDELVLHGWDIARASGQDYECDQATLEAVYGFAASFSEPGMGSATRRRCSVRWSRFPTARRSSTGCSGSRPRPRAGLPG